VSERPNTRTTADEPDTPGHVVIIGAGGVGLCCGYYLQRGGVAVTIIERGRVGRGCTTGSAGWLCPSETLPLPAPGVQRYALRSLAPTSPLHFNLAKLPALAPWLLRFWRNCNATTYGRGRAALAALGSATFGLIEEMLDDGVGLDLFRQGMVYALSDADAARTALHALEPLREYGVSLPREVLIGGELQAVEPALSSSVGAGFVFDGHWHLRPDSFTDGLAKVLRARGAEILEHTSVTSFDTEGTRVRAAHTSGGDVEGDAFVAASGVWTPHLAAKLGVKVPVQAGKGYSFSVSPQVMPAHSIDLTQAHLACTPFRDELRIAGTMEFDGLDTRINQRRLAHVVGAARHALLPWAHSEIRDVWTGLRPVTADGLPIIDRCCANAFVATGHAMLGVHLAAPTGATLADFILGRSRPAVLEPFQLGRRTLGRR